MNETPGVWRNTTILGAARIIERVGNLVVAFFLARQGGAAALGVYATVIAYFQLIASAGEMGSTNLLIREIARRPERTGSYVLHAGTMAAVLSCAVAAVGWAVIPHLGYSRELQVGLLLIVVVVLPATLNTIQQAVFVAHQRVEFETLTTLVGTAVSVTASLILLDLGHGVVSLIAVFVAAEFAVTFVYFFLIHRHIASLWVRFRWSEAREILREIRTFAASSVLGGIFARPEIILLSLLAAETQVGYYTASLKLVDLWQFAPQVYMVNVFPVLSRSYFQQDGASQGIQDKAMGGLLALGLPISAGLAFAARPIITALYGPDFGPSVLLLRLLALNVCMYCVHSVLWRVLAARGEQGKVLRVQVVTIVLRLGLGAVLISRFGAVGAAVAMPISLATHCVLLAFAVRRDGTHVHAVRLAWRFAAAAAVMGAGAGALSSVVGLPAIVVIAVVLYTAGVFAFQAVHASDMRVLHRFVPVLRRAH